MALLTARIRVFTLATALLLCAGVADAQPLVASEDEVKAAFIYRFGSFVEWPPAAETTGPQPFVIAVAGAGAIAEHLAQITAQRTIDDRPVVVRRLERGDSFDAPDILFVGRDARRFLPALIEGLHGAPTLVVSEFEDGIERGSMIDLVVADERVRFDVAPAAAEACGLKISSRVLAIARRVVPAS